VNLPPRIGRYVLEQRLEEGAVEAWLASWDDQGTRRACRLELMPSSGGSFEDNWLEESTRPVSNILEVGRADGFLFVASDWVPGVTLEALLAKAAERGKRMPAAAVAQIGVEVCAGLASSGEVHRGLVPTFVWVEPDGAARVGGFVTLQSIPSD